MLQLSSEANRLSYLYPQRAETGLSVLEELLLSRDRCVGQRGMQDLLYPNQGILEEISTIFASCEGNHWRSDTSELIGKQ